MNTQSNLIKIHIQATSLPALPGVYLFKDEKDQILYIGKAKNLKKRVLNYFQKQNIDWKCSAIVNASKKIDYIITKNELEAMLLEAQLIQGNQPKFNILLKSGQPFLYILITSPAKKLPEIKLVRTKKTKGTYFGPFLEKTPARKVYNFITKTFKLNLCKNKIESGCLEYHIGNCAGNCRLDFNKENYIKRLNLAKIALQQGHSRFLKYLKKEIETNNQNLEFEKSKELHNYYDAFEKVFEVLDTITQPNSLTKTLSQKDIWILDQEKKALFVFSENQSALKKKYSFYFPFNDNNYIDNFLGYYRSFSCPSTILINFELNNQGFAEAYTFAEASAHRSPGSSANIYTKEEILASKNLYEQFLQKWHKKQHPVSIIKPEEGHFANLIKLATIQMQEDIKKQKNLSTALKNLLHLSIEPKTIDCFDISHKQGMFMVGSCIRFKDGQPDKNKFRLFKIKTVEHQDDYACLQEIVKRRYRSPKDIPDLILIDGGKGQLSAVTKILSNANIVSLAKKDETIFSKNLPEGKKLNEQNYADQILIALRDYAHHFAINYHRKLVRV